MELSLAGKRAIVTGASGGLGLHFAGVLARSGASVTLTARRGDRVSEAAEALNSENLKAQSEMLDVTSHEEVEDLFARSEAFDIVVNNAGISGSRAALEMEMEEFDSVIATNLSGVFAVAQAAARKMKVRGGSIVNIASILGVRVSGHVAAYAASKAGVIQLTKAFALEWARYGIRVNALCPGYVETSINSDFFRSEAGHAMLRRIPQRRLGQMAELDGPLLLLASDTSSYMTGSVIAVDGGHLVSGL